MDCGRRTERLTVPQKNTAQQIAVIGGGITGLAAARELAGAGWRVSVYDKGRHPGGRTSSRRVDGGYVDHGAQYFTVRDDRFAREVHLWETEGRAARWLGRIGAFSSGRIDRHLEEIVDALADLSIDVTGSGGETVRIFAE